MPVVSVTFLDGKGSPRFLFRAWSSLATAPGVMTGGPFFSPKPLSMSRKHDKLDETIPPAINKAAALLAEAMRQENVTRKEMAERLKTSQRPGESLAQSKSQSLAFQLDPSGGNRRATGEIDAHLTLSQVTTSNGNH